MKITRQTVSELTNALTAGTWGQGCSSYGPAVNTENGEPVQPVRAVHDAAWIIMCFIIPCLFTTPKPMRLQGQPTTVLSVYSSGMPSIIWKMAGEWSTVCMLALIAGDRRRNKQEIDMCRLIVTVLHRVHVIERWQKASVSILCTVRD